MKAELINNETGETWSLESFHDCVKGFYLAPGAKKPKLTRVPKKLCTEGDPEKHVSAWIETLKKRSFSLREEDLTPADPEVTVRFTVEGAVELSWLPADLQKIADIKHGVIHIPGASDQPITMIDKVQFERDSEEDRPRQPLMSGTINFLADVVVLLRLAKALQPHGVEVCGMLDQEDISSEASVMKPDDGAEKAARWWPSLKPVLEDFDLIKVSIRRLEAKPARSWFF